MRYLATFLKIVLFLILFAFAIKNTTPVTLRGLLDLQWEAPLIVILLVFFALGALAGVLAMLLPFRRMKRELQASRQQLKHSENKELHTSTHHPVEPAEPLDAVI